MKVGQEENDDINSDSVSENLPQYGFLTPEKKRSRSVSSPTQRILPLSPRAKRSTLTDRFSTSEHLIYSPIQDEYNSICEMLSQFEHSSIYPRRIYRFEFEKLEASLWQPMKAEFYHYINALVLGNTLPSLPNLIQIYEIKQKIKFLFAGHFKSYVRVFKNEILVMHSKLMQGIFHINLSFTEESDIATAQAYLNQLSKISTRQNQYLFLQVESNLENLLIAANRNDRLFDFCLDNGFRPFWNNLLAKIHPEIIKFLMSYLSTTDKIEDIHPFHFINALYSLHRDLATMSNQLEKMLTSKLSDYPPENSREALLILRSPFSLCKNKKSDELNSIRFLALLGDTKDFHAIPELDFQRPETGDSSFLNCIRQKTFSQHMRKIFRNYTRLIDDYYDFTTLHIFAGAQQYAFDKVERLPGIGDSAIVNTYKQALTMLNEALLILTQLRVDFTEQLRNLKDFMVYFIEHKIQNLVTVHELRYQPEDQCYLLWLSRVLDYLAINDTCNELDITEQQSFADTLHQYNVAIFQIYDSIENFRKQIELKIDQFNQIQYEDTFQSQLIKTGFQLLNAHLAKYEQKAQITSQDAAEICNSINDVGKRIDDSYNNQSPKLF